MVTTLESSQTSLSEEVQSWLYEVQFFMAVTQLYFKHHFLKITFKCMDFKVEFSEKYNRKIPVMLPCPTKPWVRWFLGNTR